MAGNIKGITVEFRGDASQLDKTIRQVDKETKSIDNELKKVNNGLKFNPTSVDLWRQKQTLLTQKVQETTKRLQALKDKQKQMDADKSVNKNSKEYRELQREIITTESKLKTFKAQLKAVGNVNLRALGEKFKQIGSKMTAVGKGLSTYVTAPLVGIGAASVKAGMDFDTAMSQVAATSGKTVDEIGELRDFAKEMGSTTAFSATQAAEGLNYMALAGYDAETSMKMLPTVLDLAAAGAMELGAASDMVTDAQTALGLSVEDTTTLVDQMAKASSQSNTSVEQLGEAILKIGPTARTMAGGTEELTQVLGLLADNGIKGSEAGTHLRNILLSLNTDKVKDAFHEMGVEVFDAEGNMRSLSDIFPELSQAMEGLTNEEKTGMLAKLFNKTDLSSINSLLGTSADRWEELGEAIGDSTGAAGQMAETQLDNLEGSVTLLKSALEGAGIAIGDVLAPYIRKLADFANDLVTKFNELSPAAQQIIVGIGAVVAALGPLLVIGGMIMSAVGTILPMLPTIGAALAGISAPIAAVVAGIAALVAAFILAYNKSFQFRLVIDQVLGIIKEAFLPVFKSAKQMVKTLGDILFDTAMSVATTLMPAIKALLPVIKMVATFMAGRLKAAFTVITVAVKLVSAAIKGIAIVFAGVVTKVASLVSSLKAKFSAIAKAFKSMFSGGIKPPHIPLPHFAIKPAGWKIGDLVKGKIPSLSVDWYAKGGIFDRPTVLTGVGESGPEAVVPLDKLWDAISSLNGGVIININGYDKDKSELAEAIKQELINEVKRRRLAWQ